MSMSPAEVARRLAEAEKKSGDIPSVLRALFERVELDDLLKAIYVSQDVGQFFARVPPVIALLDFVFEAGPPPVPLDYEPPSSPGSPRKEPRKEGDRRSSVAEPSLTLEKIKTYCAEILTNPDSSAVFEVLMDTEALGHFFGYWLRPVLDTQVFPSFLRLCDFMLQRRFHAFVRALHVWEHVVPCMAMQADVPEVRALLHALISNEASLVEAVPELSWSRGSVLPLLLARLRSALDNRGDAVEVTMMCEFLGELLQYHYRSAPHVLNELVAEFHLVSSHVLSLHSDYAEEFGALFVCFFPPKCGDAVQELRPPPSVAVCDLVTQNVEAWRQPLPVSYHADVEIFLCSKEFQRRLHTFLAPELDKKRLSLNRWRALQLVSRCVQMCSEDVDHQLIKSGNLGLFLDALFAFPRSSMVHALVVDTLLYCASFSPSVKWMLVTHTFLARALDAYDEHSEGRMATRLDYIGPVGRLVAGLVAINRPAVRDALASMGSRWEDAREAAERASVEARYEVRPGAVRREGTLLERLALAQADEDSGAPPAGTPRPRRPENGTDEEVVEEFEEEIIEEVIEEIVEE